MATKRDELYSEIGRLGALSAMHLKQRDRLLAALEALYTAIGEGRIAGCIMVDSDVEATLEAALTQARVAIAAAAE